MKPFTKRDFDALTKKRGGTGKTSEWTGRRSSGLARDEVDYYRRERHLPLRGSGATASTTRRDLLEERAAERAEYPKVGLRGLRSAPKKIGGKAFLRSWGEPILKDLPPGKHEWDELLSREEREALERAKKKRSKKTVTAKDILKGRR